MRNRSLFRTPPKLREDGEGQSAQDAEAEDAMYEAGRTLLPTSSPA